VQASYEVDAEFNGYRGYFFFVPIKPDNLWNGWQIITLPSRSPYAMFYLPTKGRRSLPKKAQVEPKPVLKSEFHVVFLKMVAIKLLIFFALPINTALSTVPVYAAITCPEIGG
jgi:hypothetical protein